jgi:hypothetical protein
MKKALGGIRTHDLRFTKPSLCQAELLGQNKGTLAVRYLMLSAKVNYPRMNPGASCFIEAKTCLSGDGQVDAASQHGPVPDPVLECSSPHSSLYL